MTIITKDGGIGQACKDNNFSCILITDDKIFEKIIQSELDSQLVETAGIETTDDEVLDAFNKIKSGEVLRMAQKNSN